MTPSTASTVLDQVSRSLSKSSSTSRSKSAHQFGDAGQKGVEANATGQHGLDVR